jgi:hypothetical protein
MAKNVSDVVMGMLSDAGSATRVPPPSAAPYVAPQAEPPTPAPPDPTPQSTPALRDALPAAVPAAVSAERATATAVDTSEAPRTLRLRPEAATRLRASWLEAKRDDVLLTAQDFASDLVLEALVSRRRRRTQTPA